MALFQEKILKKFLVSDEIITEKFQNYLKYKAKAEEIKNFKEEEFQDGFLRDIFENCLSFTLKSTNPKDFNLEREKKNEKDSKKADGAILIDGKVVGIIELKSYKTKNLDEVARQAFWYLNQNSNAHFVVISNFDELRFYINKATNYEKFKLFSLDFEEFKKLYTILSFSSISENLPLKMQNESQEFEQNITKEFYKIFSKFRNELFENLLKNNKNSDKIELLNASSKLCDRFIFMLFAKDRNLLPRNIFSEIYRRFDEDFENRKLYFFFQSYFEAINSGNEKLQIQAYNGGLFAADEFLNELKIDDEILKNNLEKLNSYDFESEISVNILGHIFEQSLSDLEEIETKLNAENFDKTTSKRKKDGVFYTPNFITIFIVENSLGKLCEDKKEEFNFAKILENLKENKEKLAKIEGKKGKSSSDERKILEEKQEENLQILEKYKTWLLSLKIIDPACGSGAFLNEALEFLIKEHENLKAEMANAGNLFYGENIDISILENNLFGVDINSQAVEIAKLSLWLRTAKKGRKLTKLSDNLKSANSLLEMPFSFESFDIVLGNPPYVRHHLIENLKNDLSQVYITFNGMSDLYVYFYELGFKLLKENGILGFICSNKFFRANYGKNLRFFVLQNSKILVIVDFTGIQIFEDALVDSTINIFQKNQNNKKNYFKFYDKELENFVLLTQSSLSEESFTFSNPNEEKIKEKMEQVGTKLKDWNLEINIGIMTSLNEAFIIDEKTKNELIKEDEKSVELIKPILRGRDIKRYSYEFANLFLINSHNNPPINIEDYPAIKKHLDKFFPQLEKRANKGKTPYNLRNCAYLEEFKKEKIFWAGISMINSFVYSDSEFFINDKAFMISGENLKYILACLNSKLCFYYYKLDGIQLSSGWEFKKFKVEQIPIPKISEKEQVPFIEKADKMLTLTAKIQTLKQNFLKELEVEKIPKKLENFENLTFEEFIKELTKAKKIKFSDKLAERNFKQNWQALFENDKKEILTLQNESLKVDGEINSLIYKLYELTDEEIALVENF